MNNRIDHLLLLLKVISQMQINPDSALLPHHASVKTPLRNWFIEELSLLERKLNGLEGMGAESQSPIPHKSTKRFEGYR